MDIRIYTALQDAIKFYERLLLVCDKEDKNTAKDLEEEIAFLKQYLKDNPFKI